MNNPFVYSNDNKRYLTLAYHNRKVFGGRVYKASLQLGCSCPNIDGTAGKGGCTFCEGPSLKTKPLHEQLAKETERIWKKDKSANIIAYFQSGTNTHCDADFLYLKCTELLKRPYIAGISIGTRADCISDCTADMLFSLSNLTYLTVELGLQTIHDKTAKLINRCHTYKNFLSGYEKLRSRGIRVCVHLINSLPGEDVSMMLESAQELGKLNPNAVKIHMLHIMEGTALAQQYKASPFPLMSRDEYVSTVVKQLEYMPAATVIERLTGDGEKNRLIAPVWTADKLKTLVEIDKLQASLDSFQGKAFLRRH